MDNIAIDGPAGAGKSTVAKILAQKLGYLYIDTGAMYRALTLKALKSNINIEDEEEMINLANETEIHLQLGNPQEVYLDKINVTNEIRNPEVSQNVSIVAQYQGVREKLVALQKEMANASNIVMDGRDIGTGVLTNAKYKFYLDADLKQRAKRRYLELINQGYDVKLGDIQHTLYVRDNQDSSRKFSPLKKAEDAILIDTTNFSAEEIAEKMYKIIKGE